jgi:hypothetical protein
MRDEPVKIAPEKDSRSGGKDPLVGFRLPPELLRAVKDWAVRNKMASCSEALRALIERGLSN